MHTLRGTAARALAKTVDILEALVGQLPHSLPRVRDLVLWHSSKDALPNVVQQRGDGNSDAGKRESESREQSPSEASQRRQTRDRKHCRRGNSGKKSGHCEYVDD